MSASYETISREVGYIGHIPYPSMEKMDILLRNLSSNPTISDFKTALRLYRFTPEAETEEQRKIIYMLQLGLSISKKELYPDQKEQSMIQVAYNYIVNLIA